MIEEKKMGNTISQGTFDKEKKKEEKNNEDGAWQKKEEKNSEYWTWQKKEGKRRKIMNSI